MKKLHIAIIMQSPDIGGAETYMHLLMDKFLAAGNRISLVSNKSKFLSWSQKLPIKIYVQPIIIDIMGDWKGLIKTIVYTPYILYYYITLLKQLKKDNVDILLMSGFTEKLYVSFLSQFFNIPVVWIEYGRLESVFSRNIYIPKIIYRLLRRIPEYIIVPSENTRNSLLTQAGIAANKLILLPCGIKIPQIFTHTKDRHFRDKYVIGCVSRLTREKGQDYLIKAMPLILKKIPNAYLLLVGDGPDRVYYHSLITELGLKDNVILTGFVKDVNDYYAQMDIFIFPTVWDLEGFGLVVPEAMARNIPVAGSNTGPLPEIIDNGHTGLLFRPKDEADIAGAVIRLFTDVQKTKQMVKSAYKKANDIYDINKISNRILEIFSRVIAI